MAAATQTATQCGKVFVFHTASDGSKFSLCAKCAVQLHTPSSNGTWKRLASPYKCSWCAEIVQPGEYHPEL